MKREKIKFNRGILMTLLATVLILMSACGNTESKSKDAKSAKAPSMDIMAATLLGDLKMVKQHIDFGSDLNVTDTIVGSTALMTAAAFDRREIAKVLIEAGASVNHINKEGSTALITASFLCRKEIVRMLLDNGADKSIVNIYGSNAFQSVEAPFEQVEFIYDQFSKQLGPMGLKLDYEYVEETRPVIADMLK
jgi:uncharacterized protein